MKQNRTEKRNPLLFCAKCSSVCSKHGQAPVHSQMEIMTRQMQTLKSSYHQVLVDIFALTHVLFWGGNLFSANLLNRFLFSEGIISSRRVWLKWIGLLWSAPVGIFGAKLFTDVLDSVGLPPRFPPCSSHAAASARLASPPSCTCLQQAAVGGRVLAVRGTFQERSHPINPLSLDPTVHNACLPPSPYRSLSLCCTTISTPKSLLSLPHFPTVATSLQLSLFCSLHLKPGQAQMGYCHVIGIQGENEIKGRESPTCMVKLPGTEFLIPPNIPEWKQILCSDQQAYMGHRKMNTVTVTLQRRVTFIPLIA